MLLLINCLVNIIIIKIVLLNGLKNKSVVQFVDKMYKMFKMFDRKATLNKIMPNNILFYDKCK